MLKLYLWEYYIKWIYFLLRRRLRDRLTKTEESSSEEPVGQVNLHDHVYEIQNLANTQTVCPRTIQVQAVYEANANLLYLLIAFFSRWYFDVIVHLNLLVV